MNQVEFERFVHTNGADILRFCRMLAGSDDGGSELYQDTMLRLLEKKNKIDFSKNAKNYALSVAMFLWKNKKKKYAVRNRILPQSSLEEYMENGGALAQHEASAEKGVLHEMELAQVRALVAALPEQYRLPIYLHFSANMKMEEIAECLHIPCSTVKTRLRRAKQLIKEELEATGYDG